MYSNCLVVSPTRNQRKASNSIIDNTKRIKRLNSYAQQDALDFRSDLLLLSPRQLKVGTYRSVHMVEHLKEKVIVAHMLPCHKKNKQVQTKLMVALLFDSSLV